MAAVVVLPSEWRVTAAAIVAAVDREPDQMSHLVLIVLAAIITFASRLSFMLRPLADARVKESRFLEVFPTALFVALAVNGFVAPEGSLDLGPAMAAGIGGMAGAFLFKRSILGVVGVGLVGYWVARLIWAALDPTDPASVWCLTDRDVLVYG